MSIPAETGLLTGLADGHVRTLTRVVTAEQFKALITANGNEVIDAASILKSLTTPTDCRLQRPSQN